MPRLLCGPALERAGVVTGEKRFGKLDRHSVPLVSGVVRRKSTPFQSGLNATERARILRQPFEVYIPLSHRHVLIIDDVVTTGATTQVLAAVL